MGIHTSGATSVARADNETSSNNTGSNNTHDGISVNNTTIVDVRDSVRVVRSWGQTSGTAASMQEVKSLDQLRELLATVTNRGIILRGGGHTLGDAARCGGGTIAQLAKKLAKPAVTGINWETKRATVRLAADIATINRELLSHGWFIPTGATTAQSTFASALSTNALGPSGTVDGHAHSSVHSLVVMTPQGEVTTWARDNPEHQPLLSAFIGGQGLVAIGLSAEVSLTPVTTAWMRVESVRTTSLAQTLATLEQASTQAPYATALIDPSARGLKLGRGLVKSAQHADLSDIPESRQAHALKYADQISNPPKVVNARLLDPRIANRIHQLRYHTWPATPVVDIQPIAEFFHLADTMGKYPTLIGPQGMIRYSFAIPQASGSHIANVLMSIQRTGSTLGKVSINQSNHPGPSMLGSNNPALVATIDIAHPVGHLAETLDTCDTQIAGIGGQVLLESDTRLTPEVTRSMFSNLSQWQEIKHQLDPGQRLCSDLSRRLGL